MIIFQWELEDSLSPRAGATVYTGCVIFPVLAGVRVGVPSFVAAPIAATAGEAEGVRAQVWASACNFVEDNWFYPVFRHFLNFSKRNLRVIMEILRFSCQMQQCRLFLSVYESGDECVQTFGGLESRSL